MTELITSSPKLVYQLVGRLIENVADTTSPFFSMKHFSIGDFSISQTKGSTLRMTFRMESITALMHQNIYTNRPKTQKSHLHNAIQKVCEFFPRCAERTRRKKRHCWGEWKAKLQQHTPIPSIVYSTHCVGLNCRGWCFKRGHVVDVSGGGKWILVGFRLSLYANSNRKSRIRCFQKRVISPVFRIIWRNRNVFR